MGRRGVAVVSSSRTITRPYTPGTFIIAQHMVQGSMYELGLIISTVGVVDEDLADGHADDGIQENHSYVVLWGKRGLIDHVTGHLVYGGTLLLSNFSLKKHEHGVF